MSEPEFVIRALMREDREWVARFLDDHWLTTQIVSRGKVLYGHLLPGFVAERPLPPDEDETETEDEDATELNPLVRMEKIGLLTYNIEAQECEITTLDSTEDNEAIDIALIDDLKRAMKEQGLHRIWVVTTNDNLDALRFYQQNDFTLVAVHSNAIEQARRLKPQIPIVGDHDIPIRDEIELEYVL